MIRILFLRLFYMLRGCVPRSMLSHEVVGLMEIHAPGDSEPILVFNSDIYPNKSYFPKRLKTKTPYLDRETETAWYWDGKTFVRAELKYGMPFN